MPQFPKKYLALSLGGAIALIGILMVILPRFSELDEVESEPIIEEVATVAKEIPLFSQKTIGTSVQGRAIESYTFGNGGTDLLFVGGIHGGYEWNSVVLAYLFIDYFIEHPEAIPKDITVHIVPSANPDGVYKVTRREGKITLENVTEIEQASLGRFNANGVDLNRNFDCKWAPESTWRGAVVSAGTEAFSEPEAVAVRDYVLTTSPSAAIFWHSQASAVYASECESGILPDTLVVMNTYAKASGYKPVDSFDAYSVTGDAEGWLASINIPAITVELSTHDTIEWTKNLAGVLALFDYYTTPARLE